MRLKPFFPYMGSKWSIIEKYPQPNTDTIIEPFAGSAQYATRYHNKNIILNDLDENIYIVWKYLISVSEEEILNLDMNFHHIDDSKLTFEQKKLVGFWIGASGELPRKTKTPWFYSYLFDWRIRVSRQLKYIRHWKITNKSYIDMDNHIGTWFVDPPYQLKGQKYRKSSKQIDFRHLANWSTSRKSEYIICENLRAEWLNFEKLCDLKNSNNDKTYEAIHTNIEDKQLKLFKDI